jgi:branched-chain amino acid transport system substrate-binding protein
MGNDQTPMATVNRRRLLQSSVAASAVSWIGRAEAAQAIRIGVLTDLSGPLRDTTGPGSVAGATLAAREFVAQNPDIAVEVVAADHQNKPDIGVTIARQWYDRDGVDAITDVGNSAVAIACSTVAAEKDKVLLATSPGLGDLTGKACTPNTIHWTFNTYSIAHTISAAVVARGGTTWFVVAPNYAGGKTLLDTTTTFVEGAGGKVVGSVSYPFPDTRDFSSFLLQAQASGAKVVAFANGGDDMVNSIKQANEFGLTQGGQQMVVLAANALSLALAGLEAMQGVIVTETFYWDLNDRTRSFRKRVQPLMPAGQFPNSLHAGNYAAVLHYLKAVKEVGVGAAKASGRVAVARMKAIPTDDDCFGPGEVRADGRAIHPNYLFQAKTPGQSKGWDDVLTLLATTPASEAFEPLSKSACPLVKS